MEPEERMPQSGFRKTKSRIASAIVLTLLGAVVIGMMYPHAERILERTGEGEAAAYGGSASRAIVIGIIEEGEAVLGDRTQHFQVFHVELQDGEFAGWLAQVDYGRRQLIPGGARMNVGDEILVWVDPNPAGQLLTANYYDVVRRDPMLLLFGMFVAVSVVIGGWKGVRSLGGIAFSLAMIVLYIIPQISSGADPVWTSIIGSLLFLSITLYIVYGWTLKTHAAVAGTAVTLVLTGLLSLLAVYLTRLTGYSDESAMYLMQQASENLDMRGLLLAGLLIGSLGVLDDLVVGQSSAVFELREANRGLGFRELYRRAMNIGRDHVAATINTLVLAYTGASLPMLLLVSVNGYQYGFMILNSFIAEEIVRTLVGSIGLFVSVPVTTFLACSLALNRDRLGRLQEYLGPDNAQEGSVPSQAAGQG